MTRFRIAFQRIGRHDTVPDLIVNATGEDHLARLIRQFARPYLDTRMWVVLSLAEQHMCGELVRVATFNPAARSPSRRLRRNLMETKFVEAGHGERPGNWGKFLVARFDAAEWTEPARYPGCDYPCLIASQSWAEDMVWVMDLATQEGAGFMPGGLAEADLQRHQIRVCPLFEPFLVWLYEFVAEHAETWWQDLPRTLDLPDADFVLFGYRRPGASRR
jgi:hypothetical protein